MVQVFAKVIASTPDESRDEAANKGSRVFAGGRGEQLCGHLHHILKAGAPLRVLVGYDLCGEWKGMEGKERGKKRWRGRREGRKKWVAGRNKRKGWVRVRWKEGENGMGQCEKR